jgi:lipoprotein-anchoring transpeptidase ErfK/SrfK
MGAPARALAGAPRSAAFAAGRVPRVVPSALAAAFLAAASPAAASGLAHRQGDPTAPTRAGSWAARVIAPTPLRARPGGRTIGTLAPFTAYSHGPQQLMVTGSRRDGAGTLWLHVQLASRPNGRAAWMTAEHAQLRRLTVRVEINRATRRLTLLRRGRRIASWPIVIGAPGTPTPRGLFAVYEVVRQAPGSELGPWALHLTAHSDVLDDYGGGPGRLAMHGRSGPLLAAPLGSAASHGCIRMADGNIARLAARLRAGTPVRIR